MGNNRRNELRVRARDRPRAQRGRSSTRGLVGEGLLRGAELTPERRSSFGSEESTGAWEKSVQGVEAVEQQIGAVEGTHVIGRHEKKEQMAVGRYAGQRRWRRARRDTVAHDQDMLR